MRYLIDFQPIGKREQSLKGETLLETARRAGIVMNATCGGEGLCGTCLIRVMEGIVSPPNAAEEVELGKKRLEQGWRLACQAAAQGEVRAHLPPESLATTQRTQTEGYDQPVELAPAVRAIQVDLPLPGLDDLRSDASRLRDALNQPALSIPLPVLRTLPDYLRQHNFRASVFLRGVEVVGVRPPGTTALGLAVDLGTTKLAAYLVELASGKTLSALGAVNPQIAYGEDVMRRIHHATSQPGGEEQLRQAIVEALQGMASELCQRIDRSTSDIAEAVLVGNTAMHHLFLGLPVQQLGLAPYVAAESEPLDIPASTAGLEFAPAANLHCLPVIAGFVGADHLAMLMGSGMLDLQGNVLGMDIGTNTEISLIAKGRHFACSTASGPAFEGAHIRHGMRAAPGAIEKVLIHEGQVRLQTIDDLPAAGLCGSGILDLVAQMRKAGLLTSRGGFTSNRTNPRIRQGDHGPEYVLVSNVDDNKHGREIAFSRSDVGEIQLAKGAMRAGVNILLKKAGLSEQELDWVVIAGAFGSYLDVQSGIDIGMFPKLEREHFLQVGNAAGTGARMALLSTEKRILATRLAKKVEYIELTNEPMFSAEFTKSLKLD